MRGIEVLANLLIIFLSVRNRRLKGLNRLLLGAIWLTDKESWCWYHKWLVTIPVKDVYIGSRPIQHPKFVYVVN